MSTTRHCGEVRITLILNEDGSAYGCRLNAPGVERSIQYVDSRAANGLSFDEAAHAALTFAADEGWEGLRSADVDCAGGWRIGR